MPAFGLISEALQRITPPLGCIAPGQFAPISRLWSLPPITTTTRPPAMPSR